ALAMGVTLSLPVLFGLMAILGLAQATGWSGNVGTMANWFHKHERGKGMGVWSTNFTVGSIPSGFVYAGVLKWQSLPEITAPIRVVPDAAPWRWCFYVGALFMMVVVLQYYYLQRTRPEDLGLAPIEDPVAPATAADAPPPDDGGGRLSRA